MLPLLYVTSTPPATILLDLITAPANQDLQVREKIVKVEQSTLAGRDGRGSYFPYILLNEIQTMFSQLAKRSARVLPADLCTDHAHYVKIHRSTVLEETWRSKAELFLTIIFW